MSAELNGATERPDEGFVIANAGEFAAVWNLLTPEQRDEWFAQWRENADAASSCFIQDHRSLVERERVSWMSSHDLHAWAQRMLDFAHAWRDRPQNGDVVYSLVTMEGPQDDRREVDHHIDVVDLLRAAEIARRLAHDHVTYAVMVNVHHYARTGFGRDEVEVIEIDGRVLTDFAGFDELMTQAGWIEQ